MRCGVDVSLTTGDGVPQRILFKFSSRLKCRVLCIFTAKNYLWPETGWGRGFIDLWGVKM